MLKLGLLKNLSRYPKKNIFNANVNQIINKMRYTRLISSAGSEHYHRRDGNGSNSNHNSKTQGIKSVTTIVAFSFWNVFTGKDDEEPEETPEDKLIMNIKRGVLSIQRGDFKTAERLLHVALKMAQDLQNYQGITYIYDVLANLAMEAGDFEKAEKLFIDVMQRLFGEGYKEDSVKMLHISAKIAHLCHMRGQLDKAMNGFEWTLEKLGEKVKQYSEDEELLGLYGLVKSWFAQLLMDKKLYKSARENLEEAYNIYTKLHEDITIDGLMMLNNLSVACTEMDDIVGAIDYLKKAIEMSKDIKSMTEIGIFHANLGMLYFKQLLINEATEACKLGFRLGHSMKNQDAIEQSKYCLNKIDEYTNKK